MKKLCLFSVAALLAAAMGIVFQMIRPQGAVNQAPHATAPKSADLPAGVDETTMADIRTMLEKQEYHISYDDKKHSLQSPNRAQNLRAYYKPGKLTVQTRVDTTGHRFKMDLVNEGIFADGKPLYAPESNAPADPHENQVSIRHQAFTEEFINTENGVRQNFIVEKAPAGTRQLQVRMTAKGLKVEQGQGNELHFYSETKAGKRNELTYNDLRCWDAAKKELDATLAYVDGRIEISVDVANAAYPVTIDPIIANGTPQNANKVIEINQSSMWLGYSVSSAGDVNGDGYSDIIVGAPLYDKGSVNEGAAFIFPGTGSGISLAASTLECNQDSAQMGYAVATAGDFNGDGYSDVLVGIPFYNINGYNDGMVKLYTGSASGIQNNAVPMNFSGLHPHDFFGVSVSTAGDIDADGFSDIVIGAHQLDNGQVNEGAAYVVYGAQSGVKTTQPLEANKANAQFGFSVASAGDVDADGFSDVLVGARLYTNGAGQEQEGAAFIYRGSANGLLTNTPLIIEGGQKDAYMGYRVSSAGDVNGDGYSDVLLSAYMFDTDAINGGRVYLHLGSQTGLTPQPFRTYEGHKTDDQLGSAIACAGDVNGDGFADILIGAQRFDNGQNNEGAVFVYHGSKNGPEDNWASILESNQNEGWFGTAIASAGDVNGDGYSDVLVGCYTFDNGQVDEGHVFVYHGKASGLNANVSTTLSNNQSGSMMGASVASAGDVNADGYGDVIVGAPYYDHDEANEGIVFIYYGSSDGLNVNNKDILEHNQAESHFGNAVAGAGDVNGDGYDDIIAAAKYYTKGQTNEGVVFVHYGSAGGINLNASALLENNIPSSFFGNSISGAGDVNRDGYADIIVGIIDNYSNDQINEGAAYVYLGSANGLGNAKTLEGNQSQSHFGCSVSAAGDVDGDGYGDVIVGSEHFDAGGYTNNGAIFVFNGTPSGIDASNPNMIIGNVGSAWMGQAVSGAGDTNADGFADIIVGSNEGAAVYYGSATGVNVLSNTPLTTNISNSKFGKSVGSVGDVNGDGYGDVIVGAPNATNGQVGEGAATVYYGSPSTVISNAIFTAESDQVDGNLSTAISSAGDVNGDGYSDIIVGIPHLNNGQYADAGGVKVFYGNATKGVRNNTRLYNTNGAILDHTQFSQNGFKAGLFAKSFIGANQGKLAWETQGQGIPFNKVGTVPYQNITNSTQYTGITNGAYLPLAATGTELKNNIAKSGLTTKVRVRVKYSPALAITGQVYGPWRYLQPQLTGSAYAPVPEEAETAVKKNELVGGRDDRAEVKVFPNPVSERLRIETGDAVDYRAVRLVNAGGSTVYQSAKMEKEINVSRLAEGTYILMLIKADGSQSSHRVLIKK